MSRKHKKHARKAATPQPLQATMSYGSYDAATLSPSRPFPFWPTMQPAQEVDAHDLFAIWTRGRSLYANSSDVRMVVKNVADLLGYLMPLPCTEDEAWNREARAAFLRRVNTPGAFDASGRLTWRSATEWLEKRTMIDGDALVVLGRGADGGAQFGFYHASQVWGDGDGFTTGCKLSPAGKVLAYRLRTATGAVTIPGESAILYQHEPDPARCRGLSGLISAMNDAQDLKEFDQLTKASLKLAASFALIEKKPQQDRFAEQQALLRENAAARSGTGAAGAPAAAPAQPYAPFSVNGVQAVSLPPGRSMELLHDTRPSNETRSYMHDTKARIAYGLGFDPCLVYFVNELGSAGARYALQRNRRTLKALRVQMEELATRLYRHVLACEVAAGRLRPCPVEDWEAVRWIPLSDLTIDRGRDTTATINLVREGLADADQWTLATDGLPVEEILRRRADNIATASALAKERGIPLSLLLAGSLGSTSPTPDVEEETPQPASPES